jgi:hypothetical protein
MFTACGSPMDSPAIDAGDPGIQDAFLDCDFGLGAARSDSAAQRSCPCLLPLAGLLARFGGAWPVGRTERAAGP